MPKSAATDKELQIGSAEGSTCKLTSVGPLRCDQRHMCDFPNIHFSTMHPGTQTYHIHTHIPHTHTHTHTYHIHTHIHTHIMYQTPNFCLIFSKSGWADTAGEFGNVYLAYIQSLSILHTHTHIHTYIIP